MLEQNSCGFIIKQIHDALEKRANNSLRAQDLTLAQINVLIVLDQTTEKQMPLKELEHSLHVAQSTAAGIVSRLESKGFVEGFGDPGDRRIKMIRITELGEKCCTLADQYMEETEMDILSALTGEEQGQFIELLQRVLHTLQ